MISTQCGKSVWTRLLACALLFYTHCLALHAAETIHACVADLEYPPYLYTQHDAKSERLVGLGVDVLQFSLKKSGKPAAQIQKLPWLRCLKLTELGEIDLIINVPTAQIAPQPYRISNPYAIVHSVYITSRINSPRGLKIRTVEDLNRYRICGLLGVRYDSYGIDTNKVDTGSNNYISLVNKLQANHCDLFLEKREIIDALLARSPELKAAFSSASLMQTALPEDSPIDLHFAVSRAIPNSQTLVDALNTGISILQSTKEMDKWISSYFAPN
ncbi:MAG TPA: transporter substrate-binding domain-containing protein [Burkholderiaceae bacterium]|jgi:polar amino acid transport system substrate-binding protein|nr:transporter substrate-binding domain-containing protein [Burkholderiaceae bacterium]